MNHLNLFLGGILRTSHASIIFSATPIASCINGTGMRVAADCNNAKACFPVAVTYFVFVGTTFWGFSDNFWIQMCVRGVGRTWIKPLTALEVVSVTRFSTDVFFFVPETVVSSFSGNSWTQLAYLSRSFHNLRMILTVVLEFQRQQEKHPDDIVRILFNSAEQGGCWQGAEPI